MKQVVLAVFLFLIFAPFTPSVHAANALPNYASGYSQPNWVDNDYPTAIKECLTKNSSNGSCFASFDIRSKFADIVRATLGPVPGVTLDLAETDTRYIAQMYQGSAVAALSNTLASTFTSPPADLAYWLRDTGENLGFIPKRAYAQQGIGFAGLAPLLPIWKVFRNIAYLFLAVFMIFIGFMVMFRKKIDPKTVVTVQNALPRVIVALLLVTFSYAIVGIMIDLMYLLIFLAISLFKSTGLLPNPTGGVNQLFGIDTPEALYSRGGLLQNVTNFDFNMYKLLLGQNWDPTWATGLTMIGGIIATAGGLFLSGGNPLAAIPGGVLFLSPIIFALILALAELFLLIRLLFFFLGAYIKIVIALIFGPIELIAEAIPGTNAFSNWFKNLLSNIITFPIGAIMFMLAAIFLKISDQSSPIWSPPYAGFINNNTASIASWVALGILFAIPSVVNGIQDALKAKPLIPAGPEGVVSTISHPTLLAWQLFTFWSQRQQMGALASKLGQGQQKGGKPSS